MNNWPRLNQCTLGLLLAELVKFKQSITELNKESSLKEVWNYIRVLYTNASFSNMSTYVTQETSTASQKDPIMPLTLNCKAIHSDGP